MSINKTTETDSFYEDIDQMETNEILQNINKEDQKVSHAVKKIIPQITDFVNALLPRIKNGGRLFYIGAGTSGRLGILDASECPPTFGVTENLVIGIIAGGDQAIRRSQEFAEDNSEQAWKDLQEFDINSNDSVLGIASSGTTPYVVGGLKDAKNIGCLTAALCCNSDTPMYDYADHLLKAIVGPEFITGSTRMKSGTAQKLVLNMISTSLMIGLGRIKGNKMVDMKLSNNKLVERGTRMIVQELGIDPKHAKRELIELGSVRSVISKYRN